MSLAQKRPKFIPPYKQRRLERERWSHSERRRLNQIDRYMKAVSDLQRTEERILQIRRGAL